MTSVNSGVDPGFGQKGPQLLRPKVNEIAECSCMRKVSYLYLHLKWALEAFGFLMLKYAFFHILKTLFLLFLASTSMPKADKNRTLDCTSINLRYFCKLHPFLNLHENVMEVCQVK